MNRQANQVNAEYIETMMKKFKLVDMREQYRDLVLEAESSAMGYEEFLIRCFLQEIKKKSCKPFLQKVAIAFCI